MRISTQHNHVISNPREAEQGGQLQNLELPAEWNPTTLGALFEIQQGKALNNRSQTGKKRVPFLRTANVFWGRLQVSDVDAMDFTDEQVSRLALRSGDLLICEGGDVGRTAIWSEELPLCCHQNHVHRLRAMRDDVVPEFYMRWMDAAVRLFRLYLGAHNSTTIPNLPKNRLASFAVPRPPLPEQRAIAAVLRTVQNAKEACEKVIAATRQFKASLMHHLFTYGPVPFDQADKVQLKETDTGSVPEHWRKVRVGELGRVVTGKTPSTAKPEYWNGAIPFITPVDLTDAVIHRASRTISEEGLAMVKELPYGSIAVSCIGYIGKVGLIVCDRSATNQQINSVVPTRDYDSQFLSYRFQTVTAQLESAAAMTTVPILNKSNFEDIALLLPELAEQREIARQLSAVDAKIAAEEKRRDALAGLFKSLLHHLMTGKVRLPEFAN